MSYEVFFKWAYATGMRILENEKYEEKKGIDLLKRLIFDIRSEETPGRFLGKLSERLTEYKTNVNIQADVSLNRKIFEGEWQGDSFYYLKSAILSGFLNALSTKERRRR